MIEGWSPHAIRMLCLYNVQKVLPAVYDDSLSYYEVLAKVQAKVDELIASENNLNEWQAAQDKVINDLAKAMDDFIHGGYLDSFEDFVNGWLEDNMERIIRDAASMVLFGLTSDGYFCAYVPDSWDDIVFDTGAVYGRSDYGRLILRMNVTGRGVIDNTYSYVLNAKPNAFDALVRDLEVTANRSDASYYALFTNMDQEVTNGNF